MIIGSVEGRGQLSIATQHYNLDKTLKTFFLITANFLNVNFRWNIGRRCNPGFTQGSQHIQSIWSEVADSMPVCGIFHIQCLPMDWIFYHCQYHPRILRHRLFHHQLVFYGLHDHIHSINLPSFLVLTEICKYTYTVDICKYTYRNM